MVSSCFNKYCNVQAQIGPGINSYNIFLFFFLMHFLPEFPTKLLVVELHFGS